MPSFRLETRQHIHVVEMRLQPHVMTDNLRRSAPESYRLKEAKERAAKRAKERAAKRKPSKR